MASKSTSRSKTPVSFDPVSVNFKTLKINGLKWTVQIDPSLKDDFGSCDSNTRTISIGVLGLEAMTKNKLEWPITLIHEIIHAFRYQLGYELASASKEEREVRQLESLVYNFLVSNKTQVRKILDMIDNLT